MPLRHDDVSQITKGDVLIFWHEGQQDAKLVLEKKAYSGKLNHAAHRRGGLIGKPNETRVQFLCFSSQRGEHTITLREGGDGVLYHVDWIQGHEDP